MINRVKQIFTYATIGIAISASIASNSDAITVKVPYRNTSINRNIDFSKLFEKSLSEMLKLYKIYVEKPVTKHTSEVENPTSTPELEEKTDPTSETTKPKPVSEKTVTKLAPTPTTISNPDNPLPKPTSTTSGFSGYQQEVLDIVNKERTSRGLSALKLSSEVSKVATLKSQDMISKGYFNHNSPTYGSPFDMMKQFGISYRAAGENIAMGQRTPQEVMNGWMNSDGHRKNILSSNFTGIGIGIAKDSKGNIYWTQMFIGK